MKTLLMALTIVGMMLFSGVAVAQDNWWNEIVLNVPDVKLGYIALKSDEIDPVTEEEEGTVWEICASTELVKWDSFSGELGVSETGIVFGALTYNLIDVDNVKEVNIPGSEFMQISVGVFAGKDIDAIDGLQWSDDWEVGLTVSLLGFGS